MESALQTDEGLHLMEILAHRAKIQMADFAKLSVVGPAVTFKVSPNTHNVSTADVANVAERARSCAVLWSFASICEFCRRAKGRDGNDEGDSWGGVHRCFAELEFAQRCNVIPEPTTQPPCQPLSQAAGLISPSLALACWHRPAGTANPSLPLPQLAGFLRDPQVEMSLTVAGGVCLLQCFM
ncbi:hypothetical protein PAMP_005303 [Pampus punctatissimus]